jgi:hypothetical protein
VLFIDRDRRAGERIDAEPIPPADALLLLLENGFGEIEDRVVWAELLAAGRAVVEGAVVCRATVPDGLAALDSAIRAFGSRDAGGRR